MTFACEIVVGSFVVAVELSCNILGGTLCCRVWYGVVFAVYCDVLRVVIVMVEGC